MSPSGVVDTAEANSRQERLAHWDGVAVKRDSWRGWGAGYHGRILEIYRFLVSPGLRVLEIGCGEGDLLAGLKPSRALGIDFSGEMLKRGRLKHPEIAFLQADAHDLSFIKNSSTSSSCRARWTTFGCQRPSADQTSVCFNQGARELPRGLWRLPLAVAQWLNLAAPVLPQNWLTPADARGMLGLAGFETIRAWHEILWPFGYGGLFNRFVVRFWPFNQLALANFMIGRLQPQPVAEPPSVSVIIPARNESGNVAAIFERMPRMAARTELIFVEGHSRDDTVSAIEREIAAHPELPARLCRQSGTGKADAVRLGFAKATGDVLMILDADLTVPRRACVFLDALCSGQGEFVAACGWSIMGSKPCGA
jgi:SAM-dependent methyltransferase